MHNHMWGARKDKGSKNEAYLSNWLLVFQKVNSEEQLIMLYLKYNKDQNTNVCYFQFSGKRAKMSFKTVIRTKRKFGKLIYYTGK